MDSFVSSLPQPLQDILGVAIAGLALMVLYLSAKQDLKHSSTSAALQLLFGLFIAVAFLASVTEQPLQFMGGLFVSFIYLGYAAKTYLGFQANKPKDTKHVQ